MQLKKLYRAISDLEKKILGEQRDKDVDEDERNPPTVGILVKGRPGAANGLPSVPEVRGGEDESEKWKRLLADHKECATYQTFVRMLLKDLQTSRESSESVDSHTSPYRTRLVAQHPYEV